MNELWHNQDDDDDDDDQVDDDKMICMTCNVRLCNIYSIYNADRSNRSSWGMQQHELVKYVIIYNICDGNYNSSRCSWYIIIWYIYLKYHIIWCIYNLIV